MLFEWDERKRQANVAKHGLDFVQAQFLFDGRSIVSYPSPRGDETRFVTIGLLNNVMVALIWTEREDAIRLISLRRARDGEKRTYRARYG
jgi:uncharacterized DUF497 family protein